MGSVGITSSESGLTLAATVPPIPPHLLGLLNETTWALITRNGTIHPYIPPRAIMFPDVYRIIGTILHSLIFVMGFLGNVMICVVVRKTKSLHTPTYCYLVSLAMADILLVCSAIPEQILSYHLYSKQWVLGHTGCALMVFTTFLSINAGSISILAFTAERYVAICHPMFAQKICTVSRAKKIIICVWTVVLIYSAPWLGLAVTKPHVLLDVQGLEKCDFRLSRDQYLSFFVADVAIFYVFPLVVSVVLYVRMGAVLYRSVKKMQSTATVSSGGRRLQEAGDTGSLDRLTLNYTSSMYEAQQDRARNTIRSRVQVVKMLVVVVVCFAVLWLPYRGLLVFNSLSPRPYLDMWYVLFAKTLVYCNSAINPFLYTLLSRKFRTACFRIISCGLSSKNESFTEVSMRGMTTGTIFKSSAAHASRAMYSCPNTPIPQRNQHNHQPAPVQIQHFH